MEPVTFSRVSQNYTPTTGAMTPSTVTVAGAAMRVRGRPHVYRELGLVESKAPTLLFVPATYGETPEPGDRVEWQSLDYTVRDVEPVGPDGVTILARVIIEK